jgi:hypothetical protein
MQTNLNCTVQARIRRLKGGWKVADQDDDSQYVSTLTVDLSIIGDGKNGFHMVMQPEGLFAADTHYDSIQAAKDDAAECFGVVDSDWKDGGI